MSLAARMGDTTAHGGSIVAGYPTVLIGGVPAARITDMHACPMVTPGVPPIPHVGGPIVKGFPTVLVGNLPQSCLGDLAVCVGPPDSIVAGCPTVLIGTGGGGGGGGGGGAGGLGGASGAMSGAAASGVRQPAGAPQQQPTRSRGDGLYETPAAAPILVVGDLAYTASTLRALRAIAARETGRAAIDALLALGAPVTLRDDGGAGASVHADGDAAAVAVAMGAVEDVARAPSDAFALERCLWVTLDLLQGRTTARLDLDLRLAG